MKIIICNILLLISVKMFSQTDTSFIDRIDDKLYVSTNFSLRSFSLSLNNYKNSHSSCKYTPTVNNSVGVDFTFKNIYVSLGIPIPYSENYYRLFGKSKNTFLSGQLLRNSFILEASLRYISGFYSALDEYENPQDRYILKQQGLTYWQTGFSYLKIYNAEKYSYNAGFNFTERNRKSVGSFLFKVGIAFSRIYSDTAIIPWRYQNDYGWYGKIRGSTIYGAGVSWGYAYSIVLKKWFFISAALLSGFETRINSSLMQNAIESKQLFGISSNSELKCMVGVNGYRLYGGVGFAGDVNYNFQNMVIWKSQYNSINFVLGYRIRAPLPLKKIQHKYEQIQQKVEDRIEKIIHEKPNK